MKEIFRRVSAVILAGMLSLFGVLTAGVPVWAANCAGVETTLIECDSSSKDGVSELLLIAVRVLVVLIGVLGVIGVVISGIQYLTAGGDESKVTKAKSRLRNVVIGLIAYGLMSMFLNWLIPGGIF